MSDRRGTNSDRYSEMGTTLIHHRSTKFEDISDAKDYDMVDYETVHTSSKSCPEAKLKSLKIRMDLCLRHFVQMLKAIPNPNLSTFWFHKMVDFSTQLHKTLSESAATTVSDIPQLVGLMESIHNRITQGGLNQESERLLTDGLILDVLNQYMWELDISVSCFVTTQVKPEIQHVVFELIINNASDANELVELRLESNVVLLPGSGAMAVPLDVVAGLVRVVYYNQLRASGAHKIVLSTGIVQLHTEAKHIYRSRDGSTYCYNNEQHKFVPNSSPELTMQLIQVYTDLCKNAITLNLQLYLQPTDSVGPQTDDSSVGTRTRPGSAFNTTDGEESVESRRTTNLMSQRIEQHDSGDVLVTKYVHTTNAIVFTLSNAVVQAIFEDKMEIYFGRLVDEGQSLGPQTEVAIVVSPDQRCVMYDLFETLNSSPSTHDSFQTRIVEVAPDFRGSKSTSFSFGPTNEEIHSMYRVASYV